MRRTKIVLEGALLITGAWLWAAPRALAADVPKPPAVDPAAIAALQKMGAFLRAQPSMWVQSETTTDGFLPSGQKVQFVGNVDLKVRRPDRMHVEVISDQKNEQIYYDGVTFTVYQPPVGYYAAFAAPATLTELVNVLEKGYGVDLPLADLFRLGTDANQLAAIKRATMVGWSTIKSAVCAHYAFHQADVDWELWIEEGPQPVPRKLVVTTITEKAQPQHVSVMSWNLTPRLDDSMFVFVPPARAQRIEFVVPAGGMAATFPRSPPAAQTPPAAASPAAQSPAAQSPAAQSPAAQSPAAEGPAAQSPAAESPGAQSPGAQSLGAQSSPTSQNLASQGSAAPSPTAPGQDPLSPPPMTPPPMVPPAAPRSPEPGATPTEGATP